MHSIPVQLQTQPHPIQATLHYEHDYTQGIHHLDFLHQIRQGSMWYNNPQNDALEEFYWHSLEPFRNGFATACAGAIGNIDLLVDPPSLRGYHRPYISAFKQAYPGVYWVVFRKNAGVNANINDLDGLRKAVEFVTDSPNPNVGKIKPSSVARLLIVDDVYATGATATVVVEKLWAKKVPHNVDVHIAAPLRIPPAVMEAMKKILPI